jgi:hypothetical protein
MVLGPSVPAVCAEDAPAMRQHRRATHIRFMFPPMTILVSGRSGERPLSSTETGWRRPKANDRRPRSPAGRLRRSLPILRALTCRHLISCSRRVFILFYKPLEPVCQFCASSQLDPGRTTPSFWSPDSTADRSNRVGPPRGSESLIQEQEKEPVWALEDTFSGQKSAL